MTARGFRAAVAGTRRIHFDATPKNDKQGMDESDNDPPSRATPTKQSPVAQFAQIINASKAVYVNNERYIKLGKIGSGSGSEIFKAMNDSGNFFAVKHVKFSGSADESRTNYENEIALLGELADNDKIISLVDYEIDSSNAIMVLELGDSDLREMIEKQETMSPNYIRYTWQQMLEAVQTIHDKKIIHGDLKPSNFLMVKGTLKLIDFGIAKVISGDHSCTEFNADSLAMSSFRYKAPENMTSQHGHDGRPVKLGTSADVWSLGIILYELVYGKSPFPTGLHQFRAAVMNKDFKIPFPRRSDFHDFDCLVDVMQQCLQRSRSRRPAIEELLCHQYVQQPSSFFIEDRISIEDNLKQLAKQIQNTYADSDFASDQGRKYISMLARDLVCGKMMIVGNTSEC